MNEEVLGKYTVSIFSIACGETADLYTETDKSTEAIHKKRLNFYQHIYRTDNDRFTKNLFSIIK